MAAASAIGGIISAASSGAASAAQYQASKHERNVAWRRQQAWELMAPSLRVAGLRQAGLNPILAATQGMSGGASNVNMADAGGTPHFDSDIVGRAISSAKQAKAMDAELAALRERAAQEAIETERQREALEIFKKYGWRQADLEISSGSEQLLNIIAERSFTRAREGESGEATRRMAVDRAIMEMGLPGARAIEEMYERYPLLRQIKEAGGNNLVGGSAGVIGLGLGKLKDWGSTLPSRKEFNEKYGISANARRARERKAREARKKER